MKNENKRLMRLIMLCLFLMPIFAMAQNSHMVVCPMCKGTGRGLMPGFGPCMNCKGAGEIVDPYYVGQNYMTCMKGKGYLADGMYEEAVISFKEAADNGGIEAWLYIGYCAELGMGLSVDRSYALKCYNYAAKRGNSEAKKVLRRIQSSGYWPATDNKRQWFCRSLSLQLNNQPVVP